MAENVNVRAFRITDMIRASIIVNEPNQILDAFEILQNDFKEIQIIRMEN